MTYQRLFAFSGSVLAHTFLITLSTFAFPSSFVTLKNMSPIDLEILPANLPKEEPGAAPAISKTLPQQAQAQKGSPAALETDWDKESFEKKQAEIDQKIEKIRSDLDKAIQARKNAPSRGFELISSGVDSKEWNRYLIIVRTHVLNEWQPVLAKSEKKLERSEARLDFMIHASGKVENYDIVEWKGSSRFRDLCIQAFERSLPLPKPPAAYFKQAKEEEKSVTVSLFFYFQA